MTYTFDGYNYFVRLEVGEQLTIAIDQFSKETKLEGGWASGLGGASQIELGYYNLDSKQYQWQKFDGLREITNLTGNLAYDEEGQLMFHLHGTFADENYQTIGGHVKDFIAGATVELFVHRSFQPLHRKKDEKTGLQLLNLSQ